jgi:hypothetical protein
MIVFFNEEVYLMPDIIFVNDAQSAFRIAGKICMPGRGLPCS